jgi:hypothetical protein
MDRIRIGGSLSVMPPYCISPNRDRGDGCPSSPPTPPYMRVRIRRFGGLSHL